MNEDELESALEKGLQRQPLSPEALERVRRHVLAQYRRQTSRWRLRSWLAVAATLGVLAVGASLFRSLLLDNTVVARSGVLIPLDGGGTIRVSEGTRLGARNPHSIVLSAGRAYFDFPEGSAPFVVHTSIGTVEHIGTQFEVTQSDRGVRVRVREGSVVLRGDRRVDKGMEIAVDPRGRIEQGSYPTYGDEWAWVEAMAPPYDIENRRLSDFLTWVARETGRQIAFVDPRAREVAERTTLHGSVQGLRPLEALDHVLSTTTLRFEVRDGEIRIATRGPSS